MNIKKIDIHDISMKEVAMDILTRIDEAGVTIGYVCREAGISSETLRGWKRDESDPMTKVKAVYAVLEEIENQQGEEE